MALYKGGFPLSRNFDQRTCVNKVEAKYEKPRVKEKLNEVQLSSIP